MLSAAILVSGLTVTVRSSRIGSTTAHHTMSPTRMKLRCSTMCTGTVVSVVSYSEGMCHKRSTALKRSTAGQGRVSAHQIERSVL
jgi:hypothetical protein